MNGAPSLLVINNDLGQCDQCDWENMTMDGYHFAGQKELKKNRYVT